MSWYYFNSNSFSNDFVQKQHAQKLTRFAVYITPLAKKKLEPGYF